MVVSRTVFAMRFGAALAACLAAAFAGFASEASANDIAVAVINQSEPVLCAEKDNIAVAFQSDQVQSFRITATHPAYFDTLSRDNFAADWTSCDMSGDPVFQSGVATTTRRTLYEEPDLWVVGWTFPTFWRPSEAVVRIADATFTDLHLIQVWLLRPMGGEEVLVVYPQDGYWRLRPKAPPGRDLTAFGSSVLIGPVVEAGRPVVELQEIVFDPARRTFDVSFKAGGGARIAMSEVGDQRNVLDVTFETPVAGVPFAMVRSMYVTQHNNDASAIAVRTPDARGWTEAPILAFSAAKATAAWIGRNTVSRHNSSSPDMVFDRFRGAVD